GGVAYYIRQRPVAVDRRPAWRRHPAIDPPGEQAARVCPPGRRAGRRAASRHLRSAFTGDNADGRYPRQCIRPRPAVGDFSLIGSGGHAKATSPVFEIRFKNRSTIWKYINKSTGALMSTEPVPLPLTLHGNAGTKQKPSEGLVKAVK